MQKLLPRGLYMPQHPRKNMCKATPEACDSFGYTSVGKRECLLLRWPRSRPLNLSAPEGLEPLSGERLLWPGMVIAQNLLQKAELRRLPSHALTPKNLSCW